MRLSLAVQRGPLLRTETSQALRNRLGWTVQSLTLSGAPTRSSGGDGDVLGGRVATLHSFPEEVIVAVMANVTHSRTDTLAPALAKVFAAIERDTLNRGRRPAQ